MRGSMGHGGGESKYWLRPPTRSDVSEGGTDQDSRTDRSFRAARRRAVTTVLNDVGKAFHRGLRSVGGLFYPDTED